MFRPLINKSNAELVALVGTDQQPLAEREIRFRKLSAQLAFAAALEKKPRARKSTPAPKPAPAKPKATKSTPAPKPVVSKPAPKAPKPEQEAFRLAFAAAKSGDPTTPGKAWTGRRAYGRVLRGESVEDAVKGALADQAMALALA